MLADIKQQILIKYFGNVALSKESRAILIDSIDKRGFQLGFSIPINGDANNLVQIPITAYFPAEQFVKGVIENLNNKNELTYANFAKKIASEKNPATYYNISIVQGFVHRNKLKAEQQGLLNSLMQRDVNSGVRACYSEILGLACLQQGKAEFYQTLEWLVDLNSAFSASSLLMQDQTILQGREELVMHMQTIVDGKVLSPFESYLSTILEQNEWLEDEKGENPARELDLISGVQSARLQALQTYASQLELGDGFKTAYRDVFFEKFGAGAQIENLIKNLSPDSGNFANPVGFVDDIERRFIKSLSHTDRIRFVDGFAAEVRRLAGEWEAEIPAFLLARGRE